MAARAETAITSQNHRSVHGWLPTLRIADFEVVDWVGQCGAKARMAAWSLTAPSTRGGEDVQRPNRR
jgi:hypothetical protein